MDPVIIDVSSALHKISSAAKLDINNSSGSSITKEPVVTSQPDGVLSKFASCIVIV